MNARLLTGVLQQGLKSSGVQHPSWMSSWVSIVLAGPKRLLSSHRGSGTIPRGWFREPVIIHVLVLLCGWWRDSALSVTSRQQPLGTRCPVTAS